MFKNLWIYVLAFIAIWAMLSATAEPRGTLKGSLPYNDHSVIIDQLGIVWDDEGQVCLFRVNPGPNEEWKDCQPAEKMNFHLYSLRELGGYDVEVFIFTKYNSLSWAARPLP